MEKRCTRPVPFGSEPLPGATSRGAHYLEVYPGAWGWALFLACTGAVFMAGAKILDCLRHEQAAKPALAAPPEAANDLETRRAA